MPNGPPLLNDYFTTFLFEDVIDPETTVLSPFVDGLEFILVTQVEPLPQNPRGDQVVLVFGTAPELAALTAQRNVARIGEGAARVFIIGDTGNPRWATADLPSHWARK